MSSERVLVTGGAGFVGSHLVERLIAQGDDVVVVDDLSNSREEWVTDEATLFQRDLTNSDALEGVLTPDTDIVYHLAALKTVNTEQPHDQFRANTTMTSNVLQAMESVGVGNLAYTSSSTVYGEAPRPTPEDFGPLEPISVYGASKLADEGLLSTYGYSHDFQIWNFRFANVVGSRLRGAVVPDFIGKLSQNPDRLEILGNGRQEKSYLHVTDCIDALLTVVDSVTGPLNSFNIGTRTTTSVRRIAEIVTEEMDVDPTYEYRGGDRGWKGDVPKMQLSIEKLSMLDWIPKYESDEAIRVATRELLEEEELTPNLN
ncbi:NAD-dependent epimerase/dehydratase family protein [Natronosalvus vescus]|uniref:NAD-dependent epimerase/dehydratase family protein n=1 Tax=Natronosalvus vescus TaxID=2953881 RepID=UPI002090E70F|nr:NAD-dependent epimerase/dehydratase family protein [Natronosalvus vescus]